MPETPSTMQWCTFETSAQWPCSRPSTIHISHKRLVPVELLRHDATDEVAQLAIAPGTRKGGVPQVIRRG